MGDMIIVEYSHNKLVGIYYTTLQRWNKSPIRRVATYGERVTISRLFQHAKLLLDTICPWDPYSYSRFQRKMIQIGTSIDDLQDKHRNQANPLFLC